MRSVAILTLGVLAACAAKPGASTEWTQIQRDRLERLHAVRRPDAALAGVLGHAPQAGGQDPRHIDQREPQLPGAGPRPFRGPLLATSVALGFGNVAARIDGTRLDDRADARFLAVGLDAGTGAGLETKLWSSETELFLGQRINDGVVPADAAANLTGVDAFPHVWFSALDGALRVPVRLGVFADWQHLDHERAGVDREWIGIGPRLVIEPTWRLLSGQRAALDLVGRLGGDVGAACFGETFVGGDDRDLTVRWGGEAGLSLRALLGAMHAELGYHVQHTWYGPIDSDLFGDRARTELQRQQVFIGFGLTY